MLRVMLVDEVSERAARTRRALGKLGCEVVLHARDTLELARHVAQANPDVILIATDSPSRDTLEHLCVVSRDEPRPVVMFTHDGNPENIRAAIRAGVSAYVVDSISGERLRPVIDAAIASFQEYQALRRELEAATAKLNERKLVERAKGLLMKNRGLDEEGAYRLLRKHAMDRGLKLAEVARQVIEAAELLG